MDKSNFGEQNGAKLHIFLPCLWNFKKGKKALYSGWVQYLKRSLCAICVGAKYRMGWSLLR